MELSEFQENCNNKKCLRKQRWDSKTCIRSSKQINCYKSYERQEAKKEISRSELSKNQIETMQRLLEAPKTNTTQSDDPKLTQAESTVEEKEDVIAMPPKESEVIGNKRIPVPEHIEPELEKRGFWSRFFKPYG